MRGASALVEANIPREQSVFLLQKYWDLRPSEAEKAIWQAENRAKKGWSNLNLTVARLYGETATAVVLWNRNKEIRRWKIRLSTRYSGKCFRISIMNSFCTWKWCWKHRFRGWFWKGRRTAKSWRTERSKSIYHRKTNWGMLGKRWHTIQNHRNNAEWCRKVAAANHNGWFAKVSDRLSDAAAVKQSDDW